MQGGRQWTAFTYAGELSSTAFGFNDAGIAYTLNALFPANVSIPGIGRNFVSRDLLQVMKAQKKEAYAIKASSAYVSLLLHHLVCVCLDDASGMGALHAREQPDIVPILLGAAELEIVVDIL